MRIIVFLTFGERLTIAQLLSNYFNYHFCVFQEGRLEIFLADCSFFVRVIPILNITSFDANDNSNGVGISFDHVAMSIEKKASKEDGFQVYQLRTTMTKQRDSLKK